MSTVDSNVEYNQGYQMIKPEDSPYASNDNENISTLKTGFLSNIFAYISNINWNNVASYIIKIMMVLLVLYLIVHLFDPQDVVVSQLIHTSCCKNGPCSLENCPMKDLSNPFRIILEQKKLALQYGNFIETITKDSMEKLNFIDDSTKSSIGSIIEDSTTSLKSITMSANDLTILNQQLLKKAYSLQSNSNKRELIIIQNKITSVTNALKILVAVAIIQVKKIEVNGLYNLLKSHINDVSSLATESSRSEFENSFSSFNTAIAKITEIIGDTTNNNSQLNTIITSLITDYSDDATPITTDKLIGYLTSISNMETDLTSQYNVVIKVYLFMTQLNDITDTETFKERFEYNIPIDTANAQIAQGDYNTTIIQSSLEPSILENHKTFASERNRIDSGSGIYGIRDDPNDVINWVGLFRPTYKRSDGTSAEQSSLPLKSIPSNNPEQQMQERMKLTF